MKISFVIPCYNSSKNIEGVLKEIRDAMAARPEVEYEVVLVNDCSPDNTAAVIRELAKKDAHVIAVDLAKNVGQPNAMLAGFHYVSGDYIMTSDDDGQTPVGRVFDFLEEIEKGYDVVCARYTERNQPSFFRRLGSSLNRGMSDWLIAKPKGVYMSAFFMARRFVVDEMIRYQQPYAYTSGLILRVTQNVGNIDVEQRLRSSGSSGYTVSKLLRLWMNGFTAFSIKPLRVATAVGMTLSMLGFLAALITVIRKLVVPGIQVGWSSLIAVNLFIGGLILFFMGLIGEYIGRIYMCINETPQYVVKEVTRLEESKEQTKERSGEQSGE
ncbi:MAG: glycosyltransferase family 2 protein [Lachnospiraceae bacterium]|nr:glycosyltransferase family 2 protein [Lachnospiraceae bacterium]